jgi:hypothetical protein
MLVFKWINIASKLESFTIKSLNITLDKNEDWKRKENIDQSNVAIVAVRSQFNESDNHI